MLAEYEILGIEKNATRAEITAAYRRAAMRCHPDRHPDDPEAKKRFQEIERARRMLLSITPQIRLIREEAPPPAKEMSREDEEALAAAREMQRQAARAAAAENWQKLHDAHKELQEEKRREWEAREQQQEHTTQMGKITSPVWSIICLFIAPWAGLFAAPINIIAFSAILLLASLLFPNKAYNNNYIGLILSSLLTQGVKIYFMALAAWFLIKMANRLIN